MPRRFLLLCVVALVCACHRDAGRQDESRKTNAVAAGAPMPELTALAKDAPRSEGFIASDSGSSASVPFEGEAMPTSMIIRTGQASVQVDSLDRGIRGVRELAARVGGYVANSSILAGAEQTHTATLELKIPAPAFDAAITGLEPLGSLESVNVSAADVGEEYVDVAARAASEKRLEQRLIEILGTRTGKLSDVLAVEHELARVREEIERQEGRMRYLRSRSAHSTLAITVHEKIPVVAGTGSTGVIADAFRQAWRNCISFVASLIAALGTLLPLGIIVAAIGWAIWRARRNGQLPANEAR